MPLGLDTDRTFPLTLTDEDNSGVVFHVRFLTPRAIDKYQTDIDAKRQSLINEPDKGKALIEFGRFCAEQLVTLIRSIDGQDENGDAIPVTADALGAIMHVAERRALLHRALQFQSPRAHDFFFCASPSCAPQATSAQADNATAGA